MRSSFTNRGFTLIEMLIVIALIGILAAIAIPNYTEYITRARITEAVGGLSDMRTRMEQFFQDNRTWVGSCTAGTLAPLPANTDYFDYSCTTACGGGTSLTATGYTIMACGKGKMTGFQYRIDQNNTRTTVSLPGGWTGAGSSCWVLRKSGNC